ncbi:FecCD family ABC transporter permease [Anaerotignum sp. MB30-C6]|uniref:FecCD family ABC transporter permease n=1 Tax=Anaerotignum sp. MB30-C6 TaxID=3070814 RepID=UPI0027DB7406|nr:iron ABC transporter permease [Anaerotignum sp. MB30-C6]WMI79957.1 iron ABC transporter permease [Anaerotignum sp. MB30-C6]
MKKTIFLSILLFFTFLLSCCIGRYYLSIVDIVHIITDSGNSSAMDINIFFKIRLPRAILVTISGSALALSGFVYQSLFKNPLVSPDVLGVSGGASVGAIVAILFFSGSSVMIQVSSFFCSMFVVFCSMLLAKYMGGKPMYTMVLAGIIMSSLANAIIMSLKYLADPVKHLASIEYWLMGSFNATTWKDVLIVFTISFIATTILFFIKRRLWILALGDHEAQALGVHIRMITTLAILCATVLVSAVVSISGIVSWIGLIVPHIVRVFTGENYLENFTQSILVGGILLLIADTLARTLSASEIPISILTSFMGAIFLVIFLFLRNRSRV